MSSARIENDAYYTHPVLALAICKALHPLLVLPSQPRILEPSAGAGSFCRAARTCWGPDAYITAVEPFRGPQDKNGRPTKAGADVWRKLTLEDYCLQRSGQDVDFDLTVGNPPYMEAEAHVQLTRARSLYVAFLLRFSFLGSQRRAKEIFGAPGLRYILPLAQRPTFMDRGSDNSEYATFVWQRDYRGNAEVLPHLWVAYDE